MRIHLDTDLGGDTDDACALAMLLGWPEVEVVGVTTVADRDGVRAGYVGHCLGLAEREDVPVAAGAGVSLSTLRAADPVTGDERYWPVGIAPRPGSPGAALDLLEESIATGATVVAIGPLTNLALLEVARPGSLGRGPVVAMGGWTQPPADGLPAWGPDMDFNMQFDPLAAQVVTATAADLTLAALPATLKAHLRAAGWPGAVVEHQHLHPVIDGEVLRFPPAVDGRPVRVVVDLDGAALTEAFLDAVEAAQQPPTRDA